MSGSEEETKKLYYTIGEVAAMYDVNASLIRFWEKEFDILKPKKNKKGNRLFSQQDIDHLNVIYDLVKKRGFTIQGAKEKIKQDFKNVSSQLIVIKELEKVKLFLTQLKEEL